MPSSWHEVCSAGGYSFSIASGNSTPYAFSSDWNWPKYQTEFVGKIEGNRLASEWAGSATAYGTNRYERVFSEEEPSADRPAWQYVGTEQWDPDWTGEIASTFSRANGEVVKLWGHVNVDKDGVTVSGLALYVWS